MLHTVGIQACAGVGNATGAVTAEEDTREIPVHWVEIDTSFSPQGKVLDYPLNAEGGGESVAVLLYRFSLP